MLNKTHAMHQAGVYLQFSTMMYPGWDASPSQGYSWQ